MHSYVWMETSNTGAVRHRWILSYLSCPCTVSYLFDNKFRVVNIIVFIALWLKK